MTNVFLIILVIVILVERITMKANASFFKGMVIAFLLSILVILITFIFIWYNKVMENIIVALISAGGAIVANQALTKKSLQEKDLEHARAMQSYEDRISQLEKEREENREVVEKLNNIENTIIGMKKDIEYIKERN